MERVILKDCEKDSHKEGWKYCGESDCASCGGGVKKSFEVAWISMIKSDEKGDNAPTNPGLWAQAKSKARSKFKVYPSAYANGWAAKWYKSKGGGWKKKGKKVKKSDDVEHDFRVGDRVRSWAGEGEIDYINHQGQKVKIRLDDGSRSKFINMSGLTKITKSDDEDFFFPERAYNRKREEMGDRIEQFSRGDYMHDFPVGSELPIPGQRLTIYSKNRPSAFASQDYMQARYIGPERIGNHGVLLKVQILSDLDEYSTQGEENEGITGRTTLVDPRTSMVIVHDVHGNERVIR